ncbi:MAG: 50S ribosomal protein L29 [Candidatus Lokiarchaeota archaeon]|nr:50S ribosomal protein L29 [Candidatus Lokiarchaeota archaeon]
MTVLKAKDIREMNENERLRTLTDLRQELMMLYSMQTGGGLADNPAKAKQLRKQIARVLTVMNEVEVKEVEYEY